MGSIFNLPNYTNYQDYDHSNRLSEVQYITEDQTNDDFDRSTLTQIRLLSMQNSDPESEKPILKDTLVIHIHGGGFITMSSGTYMAQTRLWAQQNQRAVLCSIDYQLAPGARWPNQLDDVWQAYYWLVCNCEKFLGFEAKKIVLVGDSAGGNLLLAVTTMAIQRGFRVPDGQLLLYPAVNCCIREFWPSLLLSLDDAFLPTQFLHLSVVSYIPSEHLHNIEVLMSEYLSPALSTRNEVLAQYPKTITSVGGTDPFKDDIYRFVSRLLESGAKDVSMREFKMLGHAFMSHNPRGRGIQERAKDGKHDEVVRLFGDWITELIESET